MPIKTTPFSSSGFSIAKTGHGLMLMTAKEFPVDDEIAFASLKAGLDLVKPGEKVLLNSAEFYGREAPEANLKLLRRFFEKYPDYRERALISVKGGTVGGPGFGGIAPDSSAKNLRRSVLFCREALGSHVDSFEPARLDGKTPIEEIAKSLKELQDEGLFSFIGLSEVNANTLRKAEQVAHIASVEIEISPWAYEQDVKDVIATAAELDIVVVGYAPLGRGFLTGKIKREDLTDGDFRRLTPRYQEEALGLNQKILDKLTSLAQKKGVTNAQLCIGWVTSLGPHVVPLPGSSNPSRTLENFKGGDIEFTPEEKAELDAEIEVFQTIVSGGRYPEFLKHTLMQ